MPTSPPIDSEAAGTGARRWGLGAVGFLLLAVIGGLWFRHWREGSLPEVSVAELIRMEGRLFARSATNQPFNGWASETYPDGSRKSRSAVRGGLLDGVSEGWHTNGVLQVREHFSAGVAEGTVQKWHPNGQKLSEGNAVQGRLDGVFRRWHENGVQAEEVAMHLGKPDGPSRAWYPSGCLKAEVTLHEGRVLQQQFWKDGERPAGGAPAGIASNP